MKKISTVLIILLSVGMLTSSYAQKNRTLKNGFSLNFIAGVPSDSYGVEKAGDVDKEYKLTTLWGLQLGNRWYIKPSETFGIGIMANWLDVSMSAKGGSSHDVDWGRAVIDISFIELGPVATYALNEAIAFDGYYNLRPDLLTSALVTSTVGMDDQTFAYAGFGFSHALGAAFRYKVLNLGVEYDFGAINSVGAYTGPLDIGLNDQKNKTNSLRFLVGFKF